MHRSHLSLCHKDPAKSTQKCPPCWGHLAWLELCLYGIRELTLANAQTWSWNSSGLLCLNLSNIRATAVFGDHLGEILPWGLIDSEHHLSSIIKRWAAILPDKFFLRRSTAVGRLSAVGHDVSWSSKVWAISKVSLRERLWFPTVENPVATVVTLQGAGHCRQDGC